MFRLYLKGLGMMLGMIVGAGIFALPYTFSKAGIFWGLFHFFVALLIVFFLHLWYGEVTYYTRGKHRITGYTEIFLGKRAKFLVFLTTIGSYYGSLLIYGIFGGIFLSNIFGQASILWMSLLFFIGGGILALIGLEKIASLNFYLIVPLLGFIVYLFFAAIPSININNFNNTKLIFNNNWFLPYGVWLFALTGFSALPETRDIFSKMPIRNFKRIIWLSLLISAVFYLIFTFTVWGVSGKLTTEDALSGIAGILGKTAFVAGSFIGFLAVFTSYIPLIADMKGIFYFDYKIPKSLAWLLTVIPPIILFLTGVGGVVKILGIIGAVGLGILGVFIILMRHRMRKRIMEGDEGDLLKPVEEKEIKSNKFLEIFILIGIIAGVIYELWRIFG